MNRKLLRGTCFLSGLTYLHSPLILALAARKEDKRDEIAPGRNAISQEARRRIEEIPSGKMLFLIKGNVSVATRG